MMILEAISEMKNHPTSEQIIEYVREDHPNISKGTVYRVLDELVAHKVVSRVKTERDVMRYDYNIGSHHHLYCSVCDEIVDYYDEPLEKLLKQYFKEKGISGFEIEEIRLQIKGKFFKHFKDNLNK